MPFISKVDRFPVLVPGIALHTNARARVHVCVCVFVEQGVYAMAAAELHRN